MNNNIASTARSSRFATEWLDAELHEDNERPDAEELLEILHEEHTRHCQDLWRATCERRPDSAKAASE